MTATETATETPLSEMLQGLARGDEHEFIHLLTAYDQPFSVINSATTVRIHLLASDAMGVPAVEKLTTALVRAAVEFCIPRQRIDKARRYYDDHNGAFTEFSRLEEEAKALFVKADATGEAGELLLFLLMERLLGLPQILAKMSLKTNGNVHVHGSDGIHARLNDDDVLDLYWGESKLYASSTDAFTDCFESVAPFLAEDGAARARDLILVRDNINIADLELARRILEYFDDTHANSLKVRWNAVCLVGFDHADYPNIGALTAPQAADLAKAAASWRASVARRVGKHNLEKIGIDVFCIPFPDVDALRKAVRAALGA